MPQCILDLGFSMNQNEHDQLVHQDVSVLSAPGDKSKL